MAYTTFITGTVGQTITYDISNIAPDYGITWVGGRIGTTFDYQNFPYWASITDTDHVNTLVSPFNTMDLNPPLAYFLINGTDYLKQIQITPVAPGEYRFFFKVFIKVTIPNVFPIGQTQGVIVLTVNNPIPQQPPVPNLPQGIQYNTYDRLIRVEKNVPTSKSFGTDGLYPNGEQIIITSTLPAWITNNTINNKTQTWDITAPSVYTYYYYGNVYLRNEYKGTATITLQVVESLYEEIDNCCSDENVNIVWLNRQGGRGNYIFTQRKDFNVEIGKTNTYISYETKRYSEIKNVHNGFKVYATGLTLNQIDFLDTLRYSIQCWQFINDTFIPLVLDIGSFEKYNTKENMYEVSMNFIYAERLNIQRQ